MLLLVDAERRVMSGKGTESNSSCQSVLLLGAGLSIDSERAMNLGCMTRCQHGCVYTRNAKALLQLPAQPYYLLLSSLSPLLLIGRFSSQTFPRTLRHWSNEFREIQRIALSQMRVLH